MSPRSSQRKFASTLSKFSGLIPAGQSRPLAVLQFLKGQNNGAHDGAKDEGQGDTNDKRGNDPKRQVNHDDFPPLQSKSSITIA